MFTTTVTIGFTRADRENDYVPTLDGWRPGASQDIVDLSVSISEKDGIGGMSTRDVAELVMAITNHPDPTYWQHRQGAKAIEDALKLARDAGVPIRAVSIGDTVTVAGRTLACQPRGVFQAYWYDVTEQLAAARQAAAAQAS